MKDIFLFFQNFSQEKNIFLFLSQLKYIYSIYLDPKVFTLHIREFCCLIFWSSQKKFNYLDFSLNVYLTIL